MPRQITYAGVFEPTGNGAFSVYFPDLPGCTSYGETLEEARKNAQESLKLHLHGMEQDGDPIPAPSATPEIDHETVAGYLVCPVTVFPSLVQDELDNRRAKTRADKKEVFKHFLSLFPEKGLDLDPERTRDEQLGF